jgi:hypothetical protein
LSLRLVEEMLLERGIVVSYETIRCWAKKFGPDYTCRLRRKAPSPNDVWHLDEVVVTISGRRHWLWRAVQDEGLLDAGRFMLRLQRRLTATGSIVRTECRIISIISNQPKYITRLALLRSGRPLRCIQPAPGICSICEYSLINVDAGKA